MLVLYFKCTIFSVRSGNNQADGGQVTPTTTRRRMLYTWVMKGTYFRLLYVTRKDI